MIAALLAAPAWAEDGGAEVLPGGIDAGRVAADPRVAGIGALLQGALDPAVEAQSLFDVPLSDEAALLMERARLGALLAMEDERTRPRPSLHQKATRPAPGAPDASLQVEVEAIGEGPWTARIELDRARLSFYALPRPQRQALLDGQAQRSERARPLETAEAQRAREAEAERKQALEAARTARSEADRLVSEELARVISIQSSLASVGQQFAEERVALAARRDGVLGWQRRVRDARAGPPADADPVYDALRKSLRTSRDALGVALDDVAAPTSAVPALGQDPLNDVPADVPTDTVRERRALVERAAGALRAEERNLRDARASSLLEEISVLNGERLALLDHLTAEKRSAITGFTLAGWDQARAEGRQLLLILRYHRYFATQLVSGGESAALSAWRVGAVLVPWLALAAVFTWWRRRSPKWLAVAERRLVHADIADSRVSPSRPRRAVHVLVGLHRPLEWLVFFLGSMWLLPSATRALLEVQLLTSMVGWTLGGALIVNGINALAAGTGRTTASESVGRIRLRSLRLVGRVVVALVLALVVSARLVGEGTIYSWVLSTCWLAAVPVFLLVVRWWRDIVFERVGRARQKTPLQRWMLANQKGWKSFLAATLGAVQVFFVGTVKTVRNWLSGFNLARRAEAYLFRRELDRLATDQAPRETRPLPPATLAQLAPDEPPSAWIPSAADEPLRHLEERAATGQGGVVAVIGARGQGKTSALRRLLGTRADAVVASCATPADLDAVRAATAGTAPPALVLLDDAEALVRPLIGGLRGFDELLTLARDRSPQTLWVFAIDDVAWPFLQRARDGRPLFDEVHVLPPWAEEQIGELLLQRSRQAQLDPTFEDLLEKLPESADELDRVDALKARKDSYLRMLWAHVQGNPGMALEVWRASLGVDSSGVVRVRPLQVPNPLEIERLPDTTLFILRAVLQLAPANAEDVAQATRLTIEEVRSAFRFGQAHGYLSETGGRLRVSWPWLGAVLRLLERRHLLVNV